MRNMLLKFFQSTSSAMSAINRFGVTRDSFSSEGLGLCNVYYLYEYKFRIRELSMQWYLQQTQRKEREQFEGTPFVHSSVSELRLGC